VSGKTPHTLKGLHGDAGAFAKDARLVSEGEVSERREAYLDVTDVVARITLFEGAWLR
jgi:hypothetical protein